MNDGPLSEARAAAQRWLDAVNAVDPAGLLANAHVPHVRVVGTHVRLFETQDALVEATLRVHQRVAEPWKRTAFDQLRAVHVTSDKVHLAVRFTRYDHDDRPYASYDSLWVMAHVDGRWGVLARSSFAP
jgi:hypothetical protein